MGAVVAAVSPAVVVPRMLKLMDDGYGLNKSIPQMIMAGASIDDVFVIVLFTSFTGLAQSGTITPIHFLTIPTSIIFGLLGGVIVGFFLSLLFTRFHIRDTGKVLIILSVSFTCYYRKCDIWFYWIFRIIGRHGNGSYYSAEEVQGF